jgi:hypothetical protein
MMPTITQSISFKKQYWTVKRAKKWLKENGYKGVIVDETKNFYRFRQIDPEEFKPSSFRTIYFKPTIMALIGEPMKKRKNPNYDIYEYEGVEENDFHMRPTTFYVIARSPKEALEKALQNPLLKVEYGRVVGLRSEPSVIEFWSANIPYLLRNDPLLKKVNIKKYPTLNFDYENWEQNPLIGEPMENRRNPSNGKTVISVEGKKTKDLQRHAQYHFAFVHNGEFEFVSMKDWLKSSRPIVGSEYEQKMMKNILLHKAKKSISFGRLIDFNQLNTFRSQIQWFYDNGIKVTKRGISSRAFDRRNPRRQDDFIQTAFEEIDKDGTEGAFTRYVAYNFYGKNTPQKRKAVAKQIKAEYEKWVKKGKKGNAPYTLKTYKRAVFYLNIQRHRR